MFLFKVWQINRIAAVSYKVIHESLKVGILSLIKGRYVKHLLWHINLCIKQLSSNCLYLFLKLYFLTCFIGHHCILVGLLKQTICEYFYVVSAVFLCQAIENESIYYFNNVLCFQRFAAVIMRIREPKTTALIFASGKMVCS